MSDGCGDAYLDFMDRLIKQKELNKIRIGLGDSSKTSNDKPLVPSDRELREFRAEVNQSRHGKKVIKPETYSRRMITPIEEHLSSSQVGYNIGQDVVNSSKTYDYTPIAIPDDVKVAIKNNKFLKKHYALYSKRVAMSKYRRVVRPDEVTTVWGKFIVFLKQVFNIK